MSTPSKDNGSSQPPPRYGECTPSEVHYPPDPKVIKEAVERLLLSEDFLSALRTVIPKGQRDEEYGFDYIPFILGRLNEGRQRLAVSTARFLSATISLGILFSIVLVVYGYILVNAATLEPANTLSRLRDLVSQIAASSNVLQTEDGNLVADPLWAEAFAEALTSTQELKMKDGKERQGNVKRLDELSKGRSFSSLSDAVNFLTKAEELENEPSDIEPETLSRLITAKTKIKLLLEKRETALRTASQLATQVTKAVDRVEAKNSEPSNATTELLRRLAVGLVVASFFVAILRYLAGLYKEHSLRLLNVEREEIEIRKFYVAFRCAAHTDANHQGTILAAFLTAGKYTGGSTNESNSQTPDEATALVKEILSILSKKL